MGFTRLVRGVTIKEIQPYLFLFQFYHELDILKVINKGPWTFSNHMLIVKLLKASDQPKRIHLFHVDFWVQNHDLPIGFRYDFIGKNVGNYIGKFLEVDA